MAAPKTLTFVEDPLSAKFRFRFRFLNNWGFACILFTGWALLVAPFSLRWIADAVGIAVLFYIVFFVWEKRAIKICCPNCPEVLLTNTPWVCGFGGCKNENADDFPFVHECATCHAEPKAYKCHHCGQLIFLTEDHLKTNYAYCLNAPVATKEDEIDRRKREADLKQQELVIADLDERLEQIHRRREVAKKTVEEKMRESLKQELVSSMGAELAAQEETAAVDEKFKNDEDQREKAHLTIQKWLKEHVE